jgi:hypothetical protein
MLPLRGVQVDTKPRIALANNRRSPSIAVLTWCCFITYLLLPCFLQTVPAAMGDNHCIQSLWHSLQSQHTRRLLRLHHMPEGMEGVAQPLFPFSIPPSVVFNHRRQKSFCASAHHRIVVQQTNALGPKQGQL